MNDAEVGQAFAKVGAAIMALPHEDVMKFAERAVRAVVYVRPTIPPVGVN